MTGLWVTFRSSSWAWILQDTMGVSLLLLILRQFKLPNLKVWCLALQSVRVGFRPLPSMQMSCLQVACILLSLCLVYDVFWVFVQPLVTHSSSVMVTVSKHS